MPLKRCIAAPPPWPGACRAVPFAFVTRVPTQALRTVRRTIARVPGLRLAPVLPRAVRFVTMSYLMAQARRLPGPGGGKLDLPVARPTPGLAAQVALDEAVLAVMMSPKRMPRRADYERLGVEVPAEIGRASCRERAAPRA